MSRVQKVLLTIILLELSAVGFVWRLRARPLPPPLPLVDWSACLIDDTVAAQIRETEHQLRPDDPASWVELGSVYRAFGLFPQAESCYRQADKLSPKDRGDWYYWAECLDLMGRTREASKLHRRIIEAGLRAPLGAETTQYCWLNLGQDRLREENVPEAIEALRKAPDIPRAKFLLSRVLIRSGQAKEAMVLLDDLLRGSPGMVEYNQMKSWAAAELGDQEAAQEFHDRSLRSRQELSKWDPTYDEVLKRRKTMGSQKWHENSLQLEAQGNLPEAIEWSRKALEAFWTEDRAQQRAKLLLLSGKPAEAISLMKDCLKRVGASAKTLDIIGVGSMQLGESANAQRAWEQAIELEPTPNLYAKLAELRKMAGDAPQMQKYLSLEQYQIGKQAWLANDLAMAREHFEKAIALFDRHPQTWFYLAETRRILGDIAGAQAAYGRCLVINPNHGRALRGIERIRKTLP